MELDAAVSLWAEKTEAQTKAIKNGHFPKPIHKQALSGAAVSPAVAPALLYVEVTPHVASGRVWNVLGVNIYGADAHTPVNAAGVLQTAGSQAAPAANTQISGLTAAAPLAGVTYQINYSISVGGTSAAADTNNMKLMYGATNLVNPIPLSANGTASGSFIYTTTTGGQTFHVNNIAVATAGTVYGASIQAVPLTGIPALNAGVVPGTFADLYGGAALPETPVVGGALSDVLVSAAPIPSVNFVPDKAVWLHQDDTIYAIITNPPASTQFVLTARVAEYKVESVETLTIA
jgi:hypothetical protein